jgi:hypothetical protein
MNKKEENTESKLGLAPLARNGTHGAVSTSNPITKTEQKIALELHKQKFVSEAETERDRYAAQKTVEIRNSVGDAFLGMAEHHSLLDQSARGKDYEGYMAEFNHVNMQGGARNLYGIAETGGARLAEIARTSLYRDDEPERKPNVVQRMLGAR